MGNKFNFPLVAFLFLSISLNTILDMSQSFQSGFKEGFVSTSFQFGKTIMYY